MKFISVKCAIGILGVMIVSARAAPQIVERATVPDDWQQTFSKATAVTISDSIGKDTIAGEIFASPVQKIVRMQIEITELANLKAVFGPTLYDGLKGHLARIVDYDDTVASAVACCDPAYGLAWNALNPKPYQVLKDEDLGHPFDWPNPTRLTDWKSIRANPSSEAEAFFGPDSGPWEIYLVGVARFDGLVIPLTTMGRVEPAVPRIHHLSDYQTERTYLGASSLVVICPWFRSTGNAFKLSAPGGPYPDPAAMKRRALLERNFLEGLDSFPDQSEDEPWTLALPPLTDPALYE